MRNGTKTKVIGGTVVLVDDWRPASDVMSDETYVDSSYDLALMKSAMKARMNPTQIELKATSADDEHNCEFPYELLNVVDGEIDD